MIARVEVTAPRVTPHAPARCVRDDDDALDTFDAVHRRGHARRMHECVDVTTASTTIATTGRFEARTRTLTARAFDRSRQGAAREVDADPSEGAERGPHDGVH